MLEAHCREHRNLRLDKDFVTAVHLFGPFQRSLALWRQEKPNSVPPTIFPLLLLSVHVRKPNAVKRGEETIMVALSQVLHLFQQNDIKSATTSATIRVSECWPNRQGGPIGSSSS